MRAALRAVFALLPFCWVQPVLRQQLQLCSLLCQLSAPTAPSETLAAVALHCVTAQM